MDAIRPVLEISDLWVSFPAYRSEPVRALKGVDLSIARGEFIGLVGKSGSGKTTLARAAMGLVPPPGVIERGSVLFDGRDLAHLDDEARRSFLGRELAMVIANPRAELNPVLPVGRQISNIIYYHLGVARAEADRRALDMLRAVRIPDAERRFRAFPHELSGGMAQRVVIAIALACSPKLVISDDATSGLDVTVQTQVLDLLKRMVGEHGASALFITRDIAITAHFCSRIAVIYAGEIVELAPTATFFERPAHPYSIMLLAAFSHSPELRARWARPPDGDDDALPAGGCAFAPRCVRRRARCLVEAPASRPLSGGRFVRCHFPVDENAADKSVAEREHDLTALLEVQNLVKRFPLSGSRKTVQAVNGVDFSIERGETLALVGESGSGKTTIGRCVMGLIDPTAGSIWFDGKPMGRGRNIRSKELRGRIQLVFQEPAESLDPRMRIGETLGEPLRYLGLPRAERERRLRDVAGRLGLAERTLDQFPAELSAGQQQRVGIGRAVITNPELIVLDEPTSALDPTARAEIVDLLIRLQRELGTAYLFISHDLSTVRFVSHRVAVLYLGAIVEQAEAEALFARPLHPYSVGLLASVLLPDPNLKSTSAVTLKGEIPSPIDLPPGCSLAGRCPFVGERCRTTRPLPTAVGPAHYVGCFHHDQVAALDRTVDHFARFQLESSRLLSIGAPVPPHRGVDDGATPAQRAEEARSSGPPMSRAHERAKGSRSEKP